MAIRLPIGIEGGERYVMTEADLATKNPICIYDGELKELQSGDELPGSGSSYVPYVPDPWVRPADWQALPTVSALDQKLVGLVAVFDNGSNYVAFTCSGNYTVNWGDGVVENFAAGVSANHQYVYSTYDVGNATLTSRGYKTAIITITPQAGQNLTSIQLSVKPSALASLTTPVSPWLDILVSAPNATTLLISAATVAFAHYNLEKAIILSTGAANLAYCFNLCTQLQHVEANVVNATGVSFMFNGCNSLDTAPALNLTGKTVLDGLFASCTALRVVPNYNTTSATSFTSMFSGCANLEVAPTLDTSNALNVSNMYANCRTLKVVPFIDTAKVTNASSMFTGCTALWEAPCTNFPLVTSTNLINLYFGCSAMVRCGDLYAPLCTNATGIFQGCAALQEIGTITFSASLTATASMFRDCASLEVAPLFNTANVTDMNSMFYDCGQLKEVPAYNTASCQNMSSMFRRCFVLDRGPVLNTSNVTAMSNMFHQCTYLQTIPLYDTAKVTSFSNMFNACSRLTSIPALSQAAVTSSAAYTNMLTSCSNLRRCDVAFKFSVTLPNPSALVASELDRIYTNLPVVVGQTITVTGSIGTSGDTPTIATAKGWTVTG